MMGSSNCAGWGSHTPWYNTVCISTGWAHELAARLHQDYGHEVLNVARAGLKTSMVAKLLEQKVVPLNPDVVVRSRGVMEKCSLCIQMTQKTILDAKLEGREIKDGEFQTACSNACGTGALAFGDINDKESEVKHLKEDERMYHLLESVGTEPNVMYQVKVRNT